ncbi:MAG: methionyl-tRNA formyltransferase [Chloroflexi bacterium]|nr:methionyl-tRNA formyltransferase [Chloroflexota bacterium]
MDNRGPHPTGATPPRPRIVFFGSGTFALTLLDALLADPATSPVAIVSTPDRPAGRDGTPTPTPVAARARAVGADLRQPGTLRDAAAVATLRDLAPDVAVVADYGRIVPETLLAVPRRGFLNVHPSLLPRHRGATPVPATIAAGDAESGVTIIAMDAGVDTGPIVATAHRPLDGTESAPELEEALARDGAVLLATTLGRWIDGTAAAVPQPGDGATVSRTLRREDGRLDPGEAAATLERRVRALRPWPGSFVEVPQGRLIVLDASVPDAARLGGGPHGAGATVTAAPSEVPGTIVADGDGIALVTADGLLRLRRVQLAGGRPITGAELRRGRPGIVGAAVRPAVRESGR